MRHLTKYEIVTKALPKILNMTDFSDAEAVSMSEYYPEWTDLIGQTANPGMKFTHNGDLYEINPAPKPNKFQADWVPGQGTESLYRLIPEWFAGDREDPIPYKGNLALELGKFYTQDGVMYECIEDTIIPVHNPLSTMGRYVKVVE